MRLLAAVWGRYVKGMVSECEAVSTYRGLRRVVFLLVLRLHQRIDGVVFTFQLCSFKFRRGWERTAQTERSCYSAAHDMQAPVNCH